jgi:predicted nucleic acid-binding protein
LTRFVLDCSVALSWCFEDESDPYADQVLDSLQETSAIVPQLWTLEVTNVLLVAEHRSRITRAQTGRLVALLQALPINTDEQTAIRALESTLAIGRMEMISAYDASYLELAIREGLPLATLDHQLAQAASHCGVSPYLI